MVLYENNHFFLSMSDTLRWNEYSLTYSQDYINLDYKIFWHFQQIVFPKWVWYNFSSIDRPINRKTHYYQGCSGVVKRAYDTKYRNKNVYNTICCCFLKTKKSMSNLNQRGFSDLPPFFFHYNTPFGGGRLGGDKELFHIKDKRAATR